MKFIQNFLPVYLAVSLFAINGQAQEQIGVASAVNKNTTDLTLEQERKLIDAGYEIIQNHTIETDGIGRAQMLLLDGTAFSVGPNSSVVLDKFIYNPETAEGSLEVTARGLLRIVGGKVTKKQPALIRTNSATVGIRGGIGIVQTTGPQTNATFLYGTEMTVTPNCVDLDSFGDQCSPDFATTVTEPGFSVTVESEDSEPSEPVAVTEESLDALQEELEAPEEAPEEESSAEEEISEDEPAAEETPGEETQEEEAAPSEETLSEETPAEENTPESTEAESEAPAEVETETEVASDDAGDSTDIEVDESLLDSSGVSDASSDAEPEDLGTADDYEAAVELETVEADDANEDPTGEVAEEVAESTQETTVEVAPIFQVSAGESIESISENLVNETLTPLVFINPGELAYTITISGPDAEFVEFDEEALTINLISALDYETQTTLSFTVIIESENADVSEIEVLLDVTNIDEPIELTSTLLADSFAENIDLQSAILESTAIDPEGGDISFTLSGEGSENFSVDANGNISLQAELDYETNTSYALTLIASDGVNETVYEINFSVIDIDEPAVLTASTSATSFAEDSLAGINIGTASATDPEGNSITYSLSGAGSENFSVDSAGNISLVNTLDYETATSYTIALNASDGVNITSLELIITVDDVNEAPSLSNALAASSFAENISTGTTIANASASDPESQAITYSLSGTGSEYFAIDSSGNVTLAIDLDYETATSYNLTLNASDGVNTTSSDFIITVDDVNEAPSLSSSLAASSFAENISTGTTIANASASDPESQAITYSLDGTGSENFAVDSSGNVTLIAGLDYETASSYTLTLSASDGVNTITNTIAISISDVNEAPSLSSSLAASSFAENTAAGTTIATTSASDPESQTITYALSGSGSENFAVDSAGNITLVSSLDYETSTSYSLTLTASDGTNTISNIINISVDDVTELSIALASSAISLSETAASGTSVTTTTTTIDGNSTVSYSLSGTGSDQFSVDSNGNITTNGTLDYETTTSYSLTLTATDGTNTVTDNLTINITDVDLSLSASLASAAQSEGLSTGTTIATSSNSNAEGTVTYSLTDADNKFSIDSSTGEVTLANALDYETKTSHEFTITATDGVTTTSETFTLSVSDLKINTLAVTLANSGTALAESSSSGTTVGSSSVTNPESETVSYALSGTGSSNFAVDSSGNITTNATLDFETAQSYSLTLTATAGGNTTTDAFTVNVGNVEELESAVLRYSADYNSASRSGFSATATRGPSGSSLAAYTLEQVGTTNSTAITSVDDTSNNYVPVEINSGTALNWRYYFPIDTSGNGQFAFAPNSSGNVGKYYSPLGTAVTTTIALGEFLTAGRLGGAEYWFMTTDKSAANIDFTSATLGGLNVRFNLGTYYTTWTTANNALSSPYSITTNTGSSALDYSFSDVENYQVLVHGAGPPGNGSNFDSTEQAVARQFIQQENRVLVLHGENSSWSLQNDEIVTFLESIMSGSNFSHTNNGTMNTFNFTYGGVSFVQSSILRRTPSTLNCDSNFNTYCYGSWAFFPASMTDSEYTSDVFVWLDVNQPSDTTIDNTILQYAQSLSGSSSSSTYNLYEDQVTLAGEVYKDANFVSFTDSNKRVIAMAVIPIENFAASGSSNDYFIPNFIPKTLWSYGDVGHDYCLGVGNNASACNTYDNYYDFSSIALNSSDHLETSRFYGTSNRLPEGQSMWWQVLNPSGVGVGLWAQISFKDSYDGASGSTLRDDQQSLLNVVISNVDYRKNDTTRYSAGDTGLGMDGYHYWSYQGATNADNDGLGINYGTSPIECATSNDSGCFWGDSSNQPGGAMITSSDPYKSGSMSLSVNYNSNNDTFSTGSFNVSAVVQDVKPSSSSYADYASLSDFRSSDFYSSSATGYSGFFSGILEFDVSGSGNSQLSSIRSSSTLATFTFDTTNDDVQVGRTYDHQCRTFK
jgi:hypothetical protein